MKAVEVEHVSKTYKFYSKPVDRLKEVILRKSFHQPVKSIGDISFSMETGETLGIIGENGAGKSTLLKILAGTITPTSGRVNVKGRVAALLELGAGFHFEFTGRENIFLNASLLGLSQSEIKEKEGDIINFSELGAFIDRPLKTYSSGMVVRLAFSIATSVGPDILIIDEALSVGDQYFQKKCTDRMLDFRKQGKTILFCSHAMYTVNLLCPTAMWIHDGSIRENGSAAKVTASYENWCRKKSVNEYKKKSSRLSSVMERPIRLVDVLLNGRKKDLSIESGDDLTITIEYEAMCEVSFWVAAGIRRSDDLVCHAVNLSRDAAEPIKVTGRGNLTLRYLSLPFLHGEFAVVVSLLDESGLHLYHRLDSEPFTVLAPEVWKNEAGLLKLDYEWIL